MKPYPFALLTFAGILLAAFITIVLLSYFSCANAYSIDHEGNQIIPIPLKERCTAKGDVTMFAYRHRDRMTEVQMLLFLEKDWKDTWSKNANIPHTTYIDMQRIVRDVYRTDREGKYIRHCCTSEIEENRAMLEMEVCLYDTKY